MPPGMGQINVNVGFYCGKSFNVTLPEGIKTAYFFGSYSADYPDVSYFYGHIQEDGTLVRDADPGNNGHSLSYDPSTRKLTSTASYYNWFLYIVSIL